MARLSMRFGLCSTTAVLTVALAVAGCDKPTPPPRPPKTQPAQQKSPPQSQPQPKPAPRVLDRAPATGTLVIHVATPFLYHQHGSRRDRRYWVYVDGDMVEAGTAKATGDSFISVPTDDGCVLMDNSGVAARVVSGRVSYVRDGLRKSMFRQVKVQVSPGRHTVELVRPTGPTIHHTFPLAIGRKQASVAAGARSGVESPIPKTTSQFSTRALPSVSGDNLKWLEEQLHYVEKTIVRYQSDPIVMELNGLREEFLASPPTEPVAYVRLPAAHGGPRELDTQQVRMIVEWLKQKHWDWFPDGAVLSEPDPARLYTDLKKKVALYRKQVDRLAVVADALEQVEKNRRDK